MLSFTLRWQHPAKSFVLDPSGVAKAFAESNVDAIMLILNVIWEDIRNAGHSVIPPNDARVICNRLSTMFAERWPRETFDFDADTKEWPDEGWRWRWESR
jgi:hypothetical protein